MPAVMVVEDDDDIRECVAESLRDEGYEVVEAHHGQHALDLLHAIDPLPCVVLLDLMMPVMDGRTLMVRMNGTPKLAAIPVVVVSAASDLHQTPLASKVLRKPVQPYALVNVVREFCPCS